MDLRTLSYYIAVAEELNITKAAERLNMSQPPLSSQMKNLEYELNTILFIRGKRHLQLTESGKLLYRRAKEILALSNKAESEILSMSKGMSGIISIGLVEGLAPNIAASWCSEFIKIHPQIKFRILDGNTDDLIEHLRTGLISLAVITAPCDNSLLNSFPVGEEKLTAYINKNHPLANNGSDTINIMDLKDEPLIAPRRKYAIENIYKWFRNYKLEPKIVCEMDSYLDAAAFAEKGVGISLFAQTAFIPNNNIVIKELTGSTKALEYLFVWRKGHPLPSIEESFIDFVKDKVIER